MIIEAIRKQFNQNNVAIHISEANFIKEGKGETCLGK